MKNNKGFTTIEILITFVLLAIIVTSLYGTVESYKNKENIESYKSKILSYKNLLTREIQDDLIKKGLIDVRVSTTQMDITDPNNVVPERENVYLYFRDGTTSLLTIERVLADDYGTTDSTDGTDCPSGKNDMFAIYYGPYYGGTASDLTKYTLPDLGFGTNETGCKVLDLRITGVNISTDNNILTIYIEFYHPDFGTKYAIDIVCPIYFKG